jgi:hypothetical protein
MVNGYVDDQNGNEKKTNTATARFFDVVDVFGLQ